MDNKMRKAILEGVDLEKAEVVLASQSIEDEIQSMIEKLSKIQVEDLNTLKEAISIAYGIDYAAAYEERVDSILETTIDALKESKEAIGVETLKLSGEEAPVSMENDIDEIEEPEEVYSDGFDGVDSTAGPEDEPLGRAKKESINTENKNRISELSTKKLLHAKSKLDEMMSTGEALPKKESKLHTKIINEIKRRSK